MDTTIDIDSSDEVDSTFCHDSSVAVFLKDDGDESDGSRDTRTRNAGSEWEETACATAPFSCSGGSSPTLSSSPPPQQQFSCGQQTFFGLR